MLGEVKGIGKGVAGWLEEEDEQKKRRQCDEFVMVAEMVVYNRGQ